MPRPRLAPDLTPFRDSRDLRLVVMGDFVSGMGAQAALVGVAAIVVAFPALARYDTADWIGPEEPQQGVALN